MMGAALEGLMRITYLTVYRKVQELDEVTMMFLIHSKPNSGI